MLGYLLQVFQPVTLLWLSLGAVVGVVLGAIPGMSADTGIGIFLPLTFSLPPVAALASLAALYVCGSYGGNITAVLVNTPGTSDSIFMVLDGYPMTLKGQGLKAIGVTTISAFVGGVFGCIMLLTIAPPLAKLSIYFGPLELFLTIMMGIVIIIGIVKDNALKGLMAACFGVLLSLIGADGITGQYRLNFGINTIADGLPLLPTMLGTFAFSQVFTLVAENKASVVIGDDALKGNTWLTGAELKNIMPGVIVSGLIGTIVGIIPAAGTTVAAGISYNMFRQRDPDPDSFGKGNPIGLATVSSANNGVVGGSMVPLLTLGIPGNGTSALFLGGLIIHGLAPGSRLFTEYADTVYGLIFAFLFANVFILIFGMFFAKQFAKITKVPSTILIPIIAALCILGAFSYRQLPTDMILTVIFGMVGYYLSRCHFPLAPFVLAFVLGKSAEINLRRALLTLKGGAMAGIMKPLPIVLILIDIIMLIAPFWDDITGKTKKNYVKEMAKEREAEIAAEEAAKKDK